MARRLTFALAASFQDYSKRVKEAEENNVSDPNNKPLRKKFAIDLRTPEEMQQDITEQETEAWFHFDCDFVLFIVAMKPASGWLIMEEKTVLWLVLLLCKTFNHEPAIICKPQRNPQLVLGSVVRKYITTTYQIRFTFPQQRFFYTRWKRIVLLLF